MLELYYFFHKDFVVALTGKEAKYGDFYLVKDKRPVGEDWVDVELYKQGLDPEGKDGMLPAQLHATAGAMLAATPSGKLVVVSKTQVYYLFNNHPAFMPTNTE